MKQFFIFVSQSMSSVVSMTNLFRVLGIFFLVLTTTSCVKKEITDTKTNVIKVVQGLQIVKAPLVTKIFTAGVVRGVEEVPVISKAAGTITAVYFKAGDEIKKGVPMVQVENHSLLQAFRQAKINVENTQRIFRTSQELYTQDIVSKVELEQSKAKYYGALAQQNVLKLQYEDTTIKAPINGFVVQKNDAISTGSVVGEGVLVGRISNRDALKVVVSVADRFLPLISLQNKVSVNIPSAGLGPYNAKIQSISAAVDAATGGVTIEIVWTADVSLQNKLRTGLVAEVTIVVAKEATKTNLEIDTTKTDLPIIPTVAINIENEESIVYLAIGKTPDNVYTIVRTPIQTGREFIGSVEIVDDFSFINFNNIVTQNKNELPLVIISSIETLYHGQKVKVDVVGDSNIF